VLLLDPQTLLCPSCDFIQAKIAVFDFGTPKRLALVSNDNLGVKLVILAQ
jgi:hypothetical protein